MAEETPGIPVDDASPTEVVDDSVVRVRLRRAPKYGVFLGAGAAIGLIAAGVLTFAFDGTVGRTSVESAVVYSQGQVFGFLALILITVGVAAGGVVALILDRVVGRRSREVEVDRERIRIVE